MNKKIMIALSVIALLLLAGCAASPNDALEFSEMAQEPAGFLLGIWHGMISPITFVISLFNENVGMYEIYNNGGWYNCGFLLGVGGVFGGGVKEIF